MVCNHIVPSCIPHISVCPWELVGITDVIVQPLAIVGGQAPSILGECLANTRMTVDRDIDGARVGVADVLEVCKKLVSNRLKGHCMWWAGGCTIGLLMYNAAGLLRATPSPFLHSSFRNGSLV